MPPIKSVGAIMIYSEDPAKLSEWYDSTLGIKCRRNPQDGCYYGDIRDGDGRLVVRFGIYPRNLAKGSRDKGVMVNYQVNDFDEVMSRLDDNNVSLQGEPLREVYGSFAYIEDPEGNAIELWYEP